MTYRPIRPMVAASVRNLTAWPTTGFWVQPKFDGVRILIEPEIGPVLRSGDPVPCPALREALSDPALVGLDGEVTAPGGLEAAQSAVMGSARPPPGWRFHAVDDLKAFSAPFSVRLARLRDRTASLPAFAAVSPARLALKACDAGETFAQVLTDHRAVQPDVETDGLILRSPAWGYREGAASPFRGELLKVKPFGEGEAVILDLSARSDDAEAVGAFQVERGGAVFWAPLTVPRADARRLWREREGLPGRQATLRWYGRTRTGLPRHAVAVAIRRDRP